MFINQKCKGNHQKTKAVCNQQIAFYLQFILSNCINNFYTHYFFIILTAAFITLGPPSLAILANPAMPTAPTAPNAAFPTLGWCYEQYQKPSNGDNI